MRKNRLEIIKRILIEQHISDQADLLKALRKVGIQTTQATISRDIRTLKVKKIRNSEGHSRYILPKEPETDIMLMPQGEKETIVRVSYNGPWAVIRTRPGYAQGVAADLDKRAGGMLLGTIAGYDTVLVIPVEGESQSEVRGLLERLLSGHTL